MKPVTVGIGHIDLIDQLADDLYGVAGCIHSLAGSRAPFAEKAERMLSAVLEGKAHSLRLLSKELQGIDLEENEGREARA